MQAEILGDFRRIDGTPTASDDPERLLWYGVGNCCYWTDDWSKINDQSIVPSCPICGAPGMQTMAKKWFQDAADFQANGNPGYVNFLNDQKESCGSRMGIGFMARFKRWLIEHPNGKIIPNPRNGG